MNAKFRHCLLVGAAWAVCTAGSLWTLARPKTAPLDVDEIYWVGSAYYYDLAFVRHDWRNPDWTLLPARENPPVAKFAIGFGLALTGHRIASPDVLASFYALYEKIPGAWGGGAEYAKRARVVDRMSPGLRQQFQGARQLPLDAATLLPARGVMIACAALTSLLVFVLGCALAGWLPGLLASQLLLLHPIIVHAYNHAMSDAVALLLATAAGLAGALLCRLLSRREPARTLTALSGVLLGLACAAKMNSLVMALWLWISLWVMAGQAYRQGDRRQALAVAAHGAALLGAAFLVFVLVNPAILNDFVGGLIATVREPRLTEALQASFLSGTHLASLADKFRAMADLAFFGRSWALVLAVVALWSLASPRAIVRFAAGWWICAVVVVTLWLPFAWGRYLIPIIVPTVLLVAHAFNEGVRALFRFVGPGGFSDRKAPPGRITSR